MRGVLVERAGVADVGDIVPLFCTYLEFYEAPVDVARVTAFLAERVASDSVVFRARRDGATVGFAHLFPIFATLRQQRAWVLEDLFVAPAARGAGIASALIARAEAHARETSATRLSLVTARTNLRAQRVYERAGWTRDERFVTYERDL